MPHVIVEYSANLEHIINMSALCEAIRAEAATSDAFATAGIRVRAIKTDHYAIADGDPKHGFIDISIRLRGGRPDDIKKAITERVFATARTFVQPVMEKRSIALSLEMRDIDPDFSPKTGTIRDHLKKVP